MAKSTGSFQMGHGRTHGMDGTPTYRSWINMRARCTNPRDHAYLGYGGRGVTVCNRWFNSFENFLADMGAMPAGHQLDRIDNDGNYEPGNCRWATPAEQMRNTRHTKLTQELVDLIRSSPLPSPQLAPLIGVTARHIRKVRQGTRWREVVGND
jgi:hypothetical protein